MAPEVLREQPYNVKADVFSFSQVLWEILTQERAPGANSSRPMIPKEWPGTLRRILERGWSEDLNERPCMTEYKYALEDLLRQAKEASN
jgi:serine/threonine-protein kinase TNNI3K